MAIQQAFMVLGVVPPGYETYTNVGSYSFIVPPGFTEVSIVSVGGGAGGGQYGCAGGGLVWSDNVSVTPGEVLDINVGAGGTGAINSPPTLPVQGQTSYVKRRSNGEYLVKSYGGGSMSQSNLGGGGEFFSGNGRVLDGGDGEYTLAGQSTVPPQHSSTGSAFKSATWAGSSTPSGRGGGGTALISGTTGADGGFYVGNTGASGGKYGGGGAEGPAGVGNFGGTGGDGGVSIAWGAPYLIGDGFPRIDGNYSTYFRGNQYDDYFDYTPGTSGVFQLGSGNFTIEFWHRTGVVDPNGNTSSSNTGRQRSFAVFIEGYKASPLISQTWAIQANSLGQKMVWIEGGNLAFETTTDTMTNAALNQTVKWRHYAFVRNGNNLDFYLDGVNDTSINSGNGYTTSLNDTQTDSIRIGNWTANTDYNIHGWMSNVRVTKGVAVYTSNFDVWDNWNNPNQVALLPPLTEITGTSLLDFNSTSLNTAYWGPGNSTGTVSQNGGPTSSTNSPYS